MKQKKITLMFIIVWIILSIASISFASSIIKDKYKVEGDIISRILPDTTLEEFTKNIIDNANIVIENGKIGTGVVATINQGMYSLVVCGDANGDGKITATDLSRIKNHILEKSTLANLAFKAVDINEDGRITASELTKIKNYVLGLDVEFYERDLSNFSWDETTDAGKNITTKSELNFKVIALDKDGNTINDITWEVSGGALDVSEGIEVNWTLPNEENTYKITATLSDGSVLEKEIQYVNINTIFDDTELDTEEIEIDPSNDEDADGLTNLEENEIGTDIFYSDTDADGISDYEEVNTYKTNPLLKDSDEDGIEDLNEIILDMNPLLKDSDGDGIEDSDESAVYEANNEELGIRMEIEGNANIVDTEISSLKLEDLNSINAIVSPVYDFNTSGNVDRANVNINYDETVISNKGIEEENLSLYYFDPTNYTFEEVETTIDIENNTANATLEHFSMYVLADKNTMVEKLNNQIMFIIDNSASMYTYAQATEKNKNPNATTEDLENTPANDPEYKRLDTVSYLIDNLDENFEFGVSKFTGSYTTLSELGASKKEIKESLEKIKTEGETFDGTYIGASVYTAAFQFSSTRSVSKYIVLISDGKDNSPSSGIIKDMAIETLKEKGIRVIAIGIGNQVNKGELREYAEQTGGIYYHADSANMLTNIYGSLSEKLNFGRTKIGDEEYLVVADSGFVPETNGFAFKNYITSRNNGQCFGMAEFSKLFYTNSLNSSGNITKKFKDETINFNYDLSSLDALSECANLVNYKFENEALGKLMLSTNQDRLNYDKLEEDFNNGVKNLHLELKDEYKQYVEETNGVIKIKKDTGTKEGYGSLTFDSLYMDMDAITEENIEKIPDLQLFKAIEYYFMLQVHESGYGSNYDNVIMFENVSLLEDTIDKINNGIPVKIMYQTYNSPIYLKNWLFRMGDHAVNGIKILRSVEDTNKYKIAIYNNNNPMETQYLNIEKVKSLFGTMLCGYEQDGHCTNIFVEKAGE